MARRPGGIFETQNKVLPGAYYNVKSSVRSRGALGERGTVAIALPLNWGESSRIIEVTSEDLMKKSLEMFGAPYDALELKPLRELLIGAHTVLLYRINGEGTEAEATIGTASKMTATAKYKGTAGNSITIAVEENIDDSTFIVTTLYKDREVDVQEVTAVEQLQPNAFVVFSGQGSVSDTEKTPGTTLTGGTNKAGVASLDHQAFLTMIEPFNFDVLAYGGEEESIKKLYAEFTKRMVEKEGVLFQVVMHKAPSNLNNEIYLSAYSDTADEETKTGAVYWLAGQSAGCQIGETLTNKNYDGEYNIIPETSASKVAKLIEQGHLVFSGVEGDCYLVEDVNTFRDFTPSKSKDFSKNQIVRTLHARVKNMTDIFVNKYQGKVPNDADGRIALWNDFVADAEEFMAVRAIEDYTGEDTVVSAGNEKDSAVVTDNIKPTMAMQKLYVMVNITG